MSSNTALLICQVENPQSFDLEKLRQHAFTDAVDPNGLKSGWVGLGEMLDTENFSLALCDARFSGFSYRQDARKPSAAAINLQLKEKIKAEEDSGKKPGAKRRKELKEAITAALKSEAPFAPALADCIWDDEKKRLYLGVGSEKAAEVILELFKATFAMEAIPIAPEKDMALEFARIQKDNGITMLDYRILPTGDANLTMETGDGRRAIAAVNSPEAIDKALADGLTITRLGLLAQPDDEQRPALYFTMDDSLAISKLRLPKPEKGSDAEASFLINADQISIVADLTVGLSAE